MRNLVVLALLGAAGPAYAADGAIMVGVSGGIFLPDDLEVLGTSAALAPRIGYFFAPTVGIELDAEFLVAGNTQIGTPEPFQYLGVMPIVSLVGRVFVDQPVSLLLSVGAAPFIKSVNDDGALGLPQGDKVDVDFAGVAGPGLLVPIGDFAIRGDVRFVLNVGTENFMNTGDSFIDWMPTIAFVYLPIGPKDTDKDGLVDDEDRCLDQPEDMDAFEDQDGCPDTDNDADAVADLDDACPNEAEDLDGFEDDNGCPDVDNDQDGVLDTDDLCVSEAGTSGTKGCPDADQDTVADTDDECVDEPGKVEAFGCPDRDGDFVPDYRDSCPDEQAPEGSDPSRSDGCKGKFVLGAAAIVFAEKVQFETGKASIKKGSSTELLDAVAGVLIAHPSIKKVEIGGHTDSEGDDAQNLKLSQDRADSVRTYLVGKGVEGNRVVAVGYGETKPIADNATKEGREANRRVEVHILEQEKETRRAPPKPK
jgi:outer membrane protein OmpA-like peptidoglycan-associated protein